MCSLKSSDTRVTVNPDYLLSGISDNSIVIIDTRRQEEYKKGHIPSAINLPLANLLSDDSPERVAKLAGSIGIDDQSRVAIYDDTFGALASRVAWTLEYIGHRDVSLLDITYSKWLSLGLDTNKEPSKTLHKTEHSVNVVPGIVAGYEYLEKATTATSKDNVILVDNRERLNYLEQHIPGAVSLPYRTLASKDGILRDKDDMCRLFENRGITHDSEIITYCGSVGTLSGLAYYALKLAGLPNTRLYVRSFKEWKGLQKPTAKQEDANYWDLSAE